MATTIQIKRSSTASAVPLAGDLEVGELAVNLADKRLFTKKSDGTVVELSTNPTDIDIATLRIDGVEVTASAAELNSLDGSTATTADLNKLAAVTATSTELNVLDGFTGSTAELNFVDGVTSNIQTQLDNKQPLDAQLTDIAGLTPADGTFIVGNGTNFVAESGDTAIASLGITATATELNYTDGVTSNIQTQLDTKAPIASPTFTGTTTIPTVDINGGNIDGVQIGTASPNAGVFSTLNANSSFEAPNINDNATKVDLKNGGVTKLSTTSTGVDVTGTVTADGLTVENNTGSTITLSSTDTTINGGEVLGKINFYSADASGIGANNRASIEAISADGAGAGDVYIKTSTGGALVTDRVKIANNGDVSFYEDTGTTAKFVWDSSAETLELSSSTSYVTTNSGKAVGGIDLKGAYSGQGTYGAGISFGTGGTGRSAISAVATHATDNDANGLAFFVHGSSGSTADSSEVMRIDGGGNVGIGTSSPIAPVHVQKNQDSESPTVYISNESTGTSAASVLQLDANGNNFFIKNYGDGTSNANQTHFWSTAGSSQFIFGTNGSERARIDTSGNLLVGKTSTGTADGVSLFPNGSIRSDRDGNRCLDLNRKNSDGSIVSFYKDGTTVGSIGTYLGDLTVGNEDTGLLYHNADNAIKPWHVTANIARNGVTDLGDANHRFKDLYLSGGVIASGATSQILIGSSTPVGGHSELLGIKANGSSNYGVFISGDPDVSTVTAIRFYDNGATAGVRGSITFGASSTSYNTSSDYRLKENVVSMGNASERVKALKPCRFNFIDDPDTTVDGFLAHEAQEVVPEAVTGAKDAMRTEEYEVSPAVLDDDGNVIEEAVIGTREVPDYQGIDQSKLVPLLTKALQEALTEIDSLKQRVDALENK